MSPSEIRGTIERLGMELKPHKETKLLRCSSREYVGLVRHYKYVVKYSPVICISNTRNSFYFGSMKCFSYKEMIVTDIYEI